MISLKIFYLVKSVFVSGRGGGLRILLNTMGALESKKLKGTLATTLIKLIRLEIDLEPDFCAASTTHNFFLPCKHLFFNADKRLSLLGEKKQQRKNWSTFSKVHKQTSTMST